MRNAAVRLSVIDKIEKYYNVNIDPSVEQELVDTRLKIFRKEIIEKIEVGVADPLRLQETNLTAELLSSYKQAFKAALGNETEQTLAKGIAEILSQTYINYLAKLKPQQPLIQTVYEMSNVLVDNMDDHPVDAINRYIAQSGLSSEMDLDAVVKEIGIITGNDKN